ncbi:hypothetical protein [Mycoplasma putrefaciens]|uniref:Transmembrane protein n=1 Tax=Mycoplasma putrefaciens Mput9231 TaxID=1292033 RepID=M9W9F9_9MOLU|nr:hypothetical protein [Mycoplasma putrefaciens]AGJ90648.1 Hypothetical protein, predicted transmembrane protein [Mycoplasma putrefaciens Mput9231]
MKIDKNTNKRFYLNWRWYYHLVLLFILVYMFVVAIKYGVIKEGWYKNLTDNNKYNFILSYDAMNSFFTTHVNLLTFIWLTIIILGYDKIRTNSNWSWTARNLILNWNILMFLGFLVGLIFTTTRLANQLVLIERWTRYQTIVTVVVHFVVPLALVIIYFFEQNSCYYQFKKLTKYWNELVLVNIYPLFYLGFVIVRSIIYKKAVIQDYRFVYGFLNFEKPLFGSSSIVYLVLLFIITILVTLVVHINIMLYNNLCFNYQNKSSKTNQLKSDQKNLNQKNNNYKS